MVRELVCRGKASELAAHFDCLLSSLRAPSCGLRELRLVGCDWPKRRTLAELIASLPTGGIAVLVIAEMKVGGTLPEDLGQRCAEAEELCLYDLELTGAVPASLGKCAKLKELLLNGNQLEGPIPDDLGQCRELVALQLECNQLSGGVPASLGSCTKLKESRVAWARDTVRVRPRNPSP